MLRTGLGVLSLALLILSAAQFTMSAEPDGYFRIRPAWQQPGEIVGDPSPAGRVLHLSMSPVRDLRDVSLTITLPANVHLTPLTEGWEGRFGTVPARDGFQSVATELGEIKRSTATVLDFELSIPDGASGVASFTLRGTTEEGKVVSGAAGVTLGRSGDRSVRRHGAVEFPAVRLSEERQ